MRVESLQKWALLAEVGGAIAVVVTLAFVAMEMRENTNALQAQTYQELIRDLNTLRAQALNPYVAALEQKLADEGWEGLSPTERLGVRSRATQRWGIYESAFFANERGVLGAVEWERFRVAICRAVDEPDAYWAPPGVPPMRDFLTPQFIGFVERDCP